MDQNEIKPGATLHAVIGLRNYRGEASIGPVSVPIPADLRDDGGATLRRRCRCGAADGRAAPVPPQTLAQVLDRIRQARSHQNICVKLLQTAPGLSLEGRESPDLPPSVVAQLESPNSNVQKATLSRITLWETNLPAEGTFSGQITLPVRIK